MRRMWVWKCSSHRRSVSERCLIEGPSSISQNRARSACKTVVNAWNVFVAVWEFELPPITQPNRVFCRRSSGSSGWVRLICPTHIEASVELELSRTSIGAGKWNRGSANLIFLGISSVERSMGSLEIKIEMVGITRNVNVRSHASSVEVIVTWCIA